MKNLKKIGIFVSVLFFSATQVSAYENTFIEPDISFLPDTAVIGTAGENDRIANLEESYLQFCAEYGGTYVSHVGALTGTNRAVYSSGAWDTEASTSVIDSIVCDLPEPTTTNYQEGASFGSGGTIPFMYQDNYGMYHLSEEFIPYILFRIFGALIFLTLMWKLTTLVWRSGKNKSNK